MKTLLQLIFAIVWIIATAWWLFPPLGWWLLAVVICAPFALWLDRPR